MKFARFTFLGMGLGSVLYLITEVFSIYWFPPKSLPQQFLDALFYPEYLVVLLMTNWLSPNFPQVSTAYWQIVHPAWCILVGASMGWFLGASRRWRQQRTKSKTSEQ